MSGVRLEVRSRVDSAGFRALLAAVVCALVSACAAERGGSWTSVAELDARLPASIRVFQRAESDPTLQAWLVAADLAASGWEPRALLARGAPPLETVQVLAGRAGALVAVNAGYFGASGSLSLVVDEGRVLSPDAADVQRAGHRHHPARAAFGIRADGRAECAWVRVVDGSPRAWREPPRDRRNEPAGEPEVGASRAWDVRTAVGSGPMLVRDGRFVDTWEAEVFFDSGVVGQDERAPRTAVGVTHDRRLLLLVIDGRSTESPGATLAETARMLIEAGATDAINLDGGGSTTLVIAGQVVNHPSDPGGARRVGSALGLVGTSAASGL
ncbi:MAG: phosphodiester glycosidase family protein [Planctomycetota bacterium]|nr:phosphodiester glycosidase family protein [Planctomycetota bacterium]